MAEQRQRAQQQRRQRQLRPLPGLAAGLPCPPPGRPVAAAAPSAPAPAARSNSGRHALGVQRIPAAQLAQPSGQIDQMGIELLDPAQPVLRRQIGPLQAPAHHRQLHARHRDRPEQVMAQRRQHPHPGSRGARQQPSSRRRSQGKWQCGSSGSVAAAGPADAPDRPAWPDTHRTARCATCSRSSPDSAISRARAPPGSARSRRASSPPARSRQARVDQHRIGRPARPALQRLHRRALHCTSKPSSSSHSPSSSAASTWSSTTSTRTGITAEDGRDRSGSMRKNSWVFTFSTRVWRRRIRKRRCPTRPRHGVTAPRQRLGNALTRHRRLRHPAAQLRVLEPGAHVLVQADAVHVIVERLLQPTPSASWSVPVGSWKPTSFFGEAAGGSGMQRDAVRLGVHAHRRMPRAGEAVEEAALDAALLETAGARIPGVDRVLHRLRREAVHQVGVHQDAGVAERYWSRAPPAPPTPFFISEQPVGGHLQPARHGDAAALGQQLASSGVKDFSKRMLPHHEIGTPRDQLQRQRRAPSAARLVDEVEAGLAGLGDDALDAVDQLGGRRS